MSLHSELKSVIMIAIAPRHCPVRFEYRLALIFHKSLFSQAFLRLRPPNVFTRERFEATPLDADMAFLQYLYVS